LFWLEYISPLKYSFISYVKNELNAYDNDEPPLSLLRFESALTLWISAVVLIGLCLFYRIIAFIFLWAGRTRLQ